MSEITNLVNAGGLMEAISVVQKQVKEQPDNLRSRAILSELYCIAHDFVRADNQLDIILEQKPDAIGATLIRQLIRGEQARTQFYREGRLPELLNDKKLSLIEQHFKAIVELQSNSSDSEGLAKSYLQQVESEIKPLTGVANGVVFDCFRDLDDMTAYLFEILTSNGKYYCIPMNIVESIEFKPPQDTINLIWRQVNIQIRDGIAGEVYMCANYPFTNNKPDEQALLGKKTEWEQTESGVVCGTGQRMFLVGDDVLSCMQLNTLVFDE